MRTPIKDGGMPSDFNKHVLRQLKGTYSSAYVTMVRKGKRTNDEVLMAIIKTDHNFIKAHRLIL